MGHTHRDRTPHDCGQLHLCGETCDVPECVKKCTKLCNDEHIEHSCPSTTCPYRCSVEQYDDTGEENTKQCTQQCLSEDHFCYKNNKDHFCGNKHRCPRKCQHGGSCEVVALKRTELVEKTFEGKYSSFRYKSYTEHTSRIKPCQKNDPGVQEETWRRS
eukprot:UN31406